MNVLKLEKGGAIWVSVQDRENTYIQCQSCGKIYQVNRNISINVSITRTECPRCHSHSGLNCGNDESEIYLYLNPNVDERYF